MNHGLYWNKLSIFAVYKLKLLVLIGLRSLRPRPSLPLCLRLGQMPAKQLRQIVAARTKLAMDASFLVRCLWVILH